MEVINELVSIIVPVYNSEKRIERCIESIIKQTYQNWELILVNDGSLDNSLKICNDYSNHDSRIKVYSQKNKGVSEARNLGIYHAKGEFVCFVDSDDSVDDRLLEVLINNQKDSDLVICGMNRIINQKVEINCIENTTISGQEMIVDFMQKYYLFWLVSSPWGKLYKKMYIPRSGFDKDISLGEDLKFNIAYFKNISNIKVISESLYNYYDNDYSLTKVYKKGNYEAIDNIYDVTKKYVLLFNDESSIKFKNVNYKFFSFCVSFMSQNMINENKKERKELIKRICNNTNLRQAILNLPEISFIYKIYVFALKKKRTKELYLLSWIKFKINTWGRKL